MSGDTSISIPIPYTTQTIQVPRHSSTGSLSTTLRRGSGRTHSSNGSTSYNSHIHPNTSNRNIHSGQGIGMGPNGIGSSSHTFNSSAHPHPPPPPYPKSNHNGTTNNGSNTNEYISPLQSILEELRRKHSAAAGPQNGVFGVDHFAMAAMNLNYYRQGTGTGANGNHHHHHSNIGMNMNLGGAAASGSMGVSVGVDGTHSSLNTSNLLPGQQQQQAIDDSNSSHPRTNQSSYPLFHPHNSTPPTHYNHHHHPSSSLSSFHQMGHGYADTFWMEFSVLPLAYAGDVEMEDMARRLCEEEQDRSWRQLGGSGKNNHQQQQQQQQQQGNNGVTGGENGGGPRRVRNNSNNSIGGTLNPQNTFWGNATTGAAAPGNAPGLNPQLTLPPLSTNNNTAGTTSNNTTATNGSGAGGNNGAYSNSRPVSPSESSADMMSNSSRSTTPASTSTHTTHTATTNRGMNGNGPTNTNTNTIYGPNGSNGNRERTASSNSVRSISTSIHSHPESMPSTPRHLQNPQRLPPSSSSSNPQSIQPSVSTSSSIQTAAAPTAENDIRRNSSTTGGGVGGGGDFTPTTSVQSIMEKYETPRTTNVSSTNPMSPTGSGADGTSTTAAATTATASPHISYTTGLDNTSHAEHLLSYTPHLRHLTQASAEMQGISGYYQTSRNILHYFRFPTSSRNAGESTGEGGISSSVHGGGNGINRESMHGSSHGGGGGGGGGGGSNNNGMNGNASSLDYKSFLKRQGENEKVAMELAAFLRVLAHEMTLEEFASVETEVFTTVLALMQSPDRQIRLAGVAGVDALIPVASSDEERKAMKFAKNMDHSLRSSSVDYDFLSAVTKALGKMALGVDVDYVECEITRALEWLGKERSDRRLAAVLTLKELAQNAPAAFYTKTTSSSSTRGGNSEFINVITPALRDPQPIVRVCAADALSECIKIIVDPTRKNHSTTGLLCQIYSTVLEGFQMVKEKGNNHQDQKKRDHLSPAMIQAQIEAAQHSSLLIVGDMLSHVSNFMLPRFDEVTEHILALKNHPKQLLRFEVLRLIPKLARQCPGAFSRRYLEESLTYILQSATNLPTQRLRIDVRPTAYNALGQLALAMSVEESNANSKSMLQFLPRKEGEEEKGNSDDTESEFNITYRMKEGDIYSRLGEIFTLVRRGLQSQQNVSVRGVNMKPVITEALHCGADLVQALGVHAQPYISDLLNDMFEAGLTEDLIHCLRAVAASLPSEVTTIEKRVLQEICLSLAGTSAVNEICDPFSNWNRNGGNTKYISTASDLSPSKRQNSDAENDIQATSPCNNIIINMSDNRDDIKTIVLSLKTLGTLGKSHCDSEDSGVGTTMTLLPFVEKVVGQYLSHPSVLVRREAAITCCLLLLPEGDDFHEDRHMNEIGLIPPFPTFWMGSRVGSASFALVERVLQKLLCVAVSDPSSAVRHCIVRAFDVKYDPHLCQAHHLPSLFLLLQDEALAVRAAALRLLGRLARLNAAPILPVLRRVLKELIIELRCSGDSGGAKEAATRLLIVFLRADALHRLVHPFLPSIIDALPMTGVAPRVASAALEALGELAIVVKDALIPWMHELLPHIMETIQDQSSASKQRTSLRTLGLIAGSTGYVVSPYLDYPQLLAQAADVLPATKQAPWALRREVIRTLGILGALDPYRFKAVASANTRKGGGAGSGYFVGIDDEREANTNAGRQRSISINNNTVSFSMKNDGNNNPSPLVKNDQRGNPAYIRNESMDGLQHKKNNNEEDDDDEPAHLYMYEQYAMTAQAVSKLPPAIRMAPSDEDFYPTVALQALTRILKDPSLAAYHGMVMQAVMYIFNSLGLRCVPFLKRIVPHILQTARTCNQAKLSKALLQQVASLSGIVREHLRPYVPDIFEAVEELWNSKHLATVLELVEKMAAGVPDDFRKYVPGIVPRLLSNIEEFSAGSWIRSERINSNPDYPEFVKLELILKSIRSLRGTLGDYMHLIIPTLLKLADSIIDPALDFRGEMRQKFTAVTVNCIKTMMILLHASENERPSELGSSIGLRVQYSSATLPAKAAQPLIRLLGTETNMGLEVGNVLVEALCICARLLGRERWIALYHNAARNAVIIWQDWANVAYPTDPESGQALLDIGSDHSHHVLTGVLLYDQIINDMLNDVPSTVFSWLQSDNAESHLHSRGTNADLGLNGFDVSSNNLEQEIQTQQPQIQSNQVNRYRINQVNLERAWDVSQKVTREDWDEWMRRFAVMLLKEAPAPVLRATGELANAYQPLARELFSAAFVCCWAELTDYYKESLLHALKTAFFADDVSPEILQTLLNLAEFMEHDGVEGGLPIDINILAELALKCRSYAKALHYKEREHHDLGGGSCIEDLISINKKLDLPEAALGVLKAAQVELERNGAESWKQSRYYAVNSISQNQFSSKIFHRHRGVGLAYSVMATSDEVSGRGKKSIWAGVEMQMSWLAKLGSWSDALGMYERRLEENPGDIEAILGCMKCLDARGDWGKVLDVAKKSWDAISNDPRENRKASKFCAQAAWRLEQWDDLETYSQKLVESGYDHYQYQQGNPPRVDFDGAFYSALLNIHRNEWSLAGDYIDAARRAMDSRFTALMTESHKRAYPNMVRAQTLSEMEEIIAYRKLEARAKAGCHKHLANRDDEVDARKRLVQLWRKRLAGCRVDAEVHSSIIAVRSLVLGPTDEVEATLKLSALSRQAQSFKLGERVLLDPLKKLGADLNGSVFGFNLPDNLALGLLRTKDGKCVTSNDIDHLVTGPGRYFSPKYGPLHQEYCQNLISSAGGLDRLNVQHQFYYAYVKHLWAMGHTSEAMNRLSRLSDVVDMMADCQQHNQNDLRVACWLKLGEWKIEERTPTGGKLVEDVQLDAIMSFKRATSQNCNGYKAWHAWALINFRLAQQSQGSRKNTLGSTNRKSRNSVNSDKTVRNHIVAATQSFVQAICCGTKRWSASVQQDLLNFLTCLFQYADIPEVATVINEEIGAVTLEAWLGVLPQLLARIHIKSPNVRNVLHRLLTRLGEEHPQALMYPLSVLLKSPVPERNKAAEKLMSSLKRHSYDLVQEALMVSSELIRVAILWLELWHEGLEDASRLYFGEGNVSGMLDVLRPLHEELERGPSTRREHEFHKSFGRDLAEAHAFLKEYVRLTENDGGVIPTEGGFIQGNQVDATGLSATRRNIEAESALNQAWDLYYTVFRRINKQLPGLTTLELQQSSPALLQAHNLELSVPGSYRVDKSYVKIERFIPSVQVITSKQRPRKIVLRGSDGKDYVFLLKGHEDLRQDERVMQLFGLVNALLARDHRTNKHDLNIQRYTIAPLSHNAGLVGWVPHCDTFHSLIRDYRENKKIPLNMENREMLKLAPDYDLLTVMQKIEIFSEALDRTTGKGNDLYEVLWIKSTNSEEWLERRTKFTRSLAVMSMVGYILGLGDRHPSNLMLDQISGRVLHIDFGDCFEVAMHREKFPEKIPFRLTRMLTKAMEVSGIEGSYRSTCENTMGVLRDNKDSLVAMLQAFVFDPLISWRLLRQASGDTGTDDGQRQNSGTGQSMKSSSSRISSNRSDKSSSREVETDRVDPVMTGGRSFAASFVHEPIQEKMNEDMDDLSERSSVSESSSVGPLTDTAVNGEDETGISYVPDNQVVAAAPAARSNTRSLQMYSDIQNMAATLSSSSRIASITGDGTYRSRVEGSLARSRLERSVRQREQMSLIGGEMDLANNEEALNEKALKVIRRVQDKLTGTDFNASDDEDCEPLDVQDQVQRLIVQATSTENLCQLFIGWCAFW